MWTDDVLSRKPLRHAVNLTGMVPGDWFWFCDRCGYQHAPVNVVIAAKCPCPNCNGVGLTQCTVREIDMPANNPNWPDEWLPVTR